MLQKDDLRREYGRLHGIIRCTGILVNLECKENVNVGVDVDVGVNGNVETETATLTPIADYNAVMWDDLLDELERLKAILLRNDANNLFLPFQEAETNYDNNDDDDDDDLEDASVNQELAGHTLFNEQYHQVVLSLQFRKFVSYMLPLFKHNHHGDSDEHGHGRELDKETVSEML